MPAARPRPSNNPERASKKAKPAPAINFPDAAARTALRQSYDASTPFKHTIVNNLLSDELVSMLR